jgi:ABC-type nitrate/sulfonate/bicarbonate transport system ATPase subunit
LQKDLLLPWRTVLDNSVILGYGDPGRAACARHAAARCRCSSRYGSAGFEYLYPSSLSGGMRQRAALLRTLLFDTDVILLDEPFGALDAADQAADAGVADALWSDFGKTVLFVTHDVEEGDLSLRRGARHGHAPGRIIATSRSPCPARAFARARSPRTSSPSRSAASIFSAPMRPLPLQ